MAGAKGCAVKAGQEDSARACMWLRMDWAKEHAVCFVHMAQRVGQEPKEDTARQQVWGDPKGEIVGLYSWARGRVTPVRELGWEFAGFEGLEGRCQVRLAGPEGPMLGVSLLGDKSTRTAGSREPLSSRG